MSKVELHVLCFNEAQIMPYTMRHYRDFCASLIVHDLGSEDGSQEVAVKFGAKVVQHDGRKEFSDAQNTRLKNTAWHGTDADWVIMADCDELLHFPAGVRETLKSLDEQQIAVANPYGYEMLSDVFPIGDGQITQYVKMGARDDLWYAKKILFSPKRVAAISFGAGAHVTDATLHGGRKIRLDASSPRSSPSVFLLHFHHIHPVEVIGQKYEAVIARLSAENRQYNQGVQRNGNQHAIDKRRAIMAKLERVLA